MGPAVDRFHGDGLERYGPVGRTRWRSGRVSDARTYVVGNRLWWGGALFIAPIVAAIAHSPAAGGVAAVVLVLPAMLIFDTDRAWWSAEVKRLPEDKAMSKRETRLLTIWAAAGLGLGLVAAFALSSMAA